LLIDENPVKVLFLYHGWRITSGVGGGEFTKTLRKACACQKLKFSFLLLEYCKIRECYAVANAFTIRNTDTKKYMDQS
jgi:hypothetical protein